MAIFEKIVRKIRGFTLCSDQHTHFRMTYLRHFTAVSECDKNDDNETMGQNQFRNFETTEQIDLKSEGIPEDCTKIVNTTATGPTFSVLFWYQAISSFEVQVIIHPHSKI